jgi:hypothetical protein
MTFQEQRSDFIVKNLAAIADVLEFIAARSAGELARHNTYNGLRELFAGGAAELASDGVELPAALTERVERADATTEQMREQAARARLVAVK